MADLTSLQSTTPVEVVNEASGNVLAVNSDGSAKAQILDGSGNTIASLDDGNGTKAIEVAQSATGFVLSSGNSSTAQLAASATFTGTIATVINQQDISLLVTSDQPGTLTVKQYIDAAGTRLSQSIAYAVAAGVGFSRSAVLNGNYAQVLFQNTGASTTTTLNINTYFGTIEASTQLNNKPVSLQEINGTAFSLGQQVSSLSLPVVLAAPLAYAASAVGLVSVALATDIFTITGSATKTIKITRIELSGTTTAGSGLGVNVSLTKHSTANSGGVSSTLSLVPMDSSNASATATVLSYTSNPTVGTVVGTIRANRYSFVATGAESNSLIWDFSSRTAQPPVLRGTSQQLAINLNSTTVVGSVINISVEFTEE